MNLAHESAQRENELIEQVIDVSLIDGSQLGRFSKFGVGKVDKSLMRFIGPARSSSWQKSGEKKGLVRGG